MQLERQPVVGDRAGRRTVAPVTTLRAAVAVLALAVAALALAAPASAHAQWLGSTPEEGAVLTGLPDVVVMTYSEEIAPQFVDTAVVPPGGEPVVVEAVADGVDVTIDVAASPEVAGLATQAGEWQVVARVVSADGHPVEHTSGFELEPAAAPAPEPTPATPGTDAATTAAPGAGPTGDAASAEPTTGTGATVATTSAEQPTASAEPTTISSDPVAGVAEGLPGWLVPLVVLAVLGAGAAAVVVHLRRRPPEA